MEHSTVTAPPDKHEKYVPMKSAHAWVHGHYFDKHDRRVASSRTTPVSGEYPHKVGTWAIDHVKLSRGRAVEKLMRLPVHSLRLSEGDYTKSNEEGRGYDAHRYAGWLKQGHRPPPISVVEQDDGGLSVSNGHRRVAAAKLAGHTHIDAWVSPRMDTGRIDSNGKPIYVGMTHEGIHGDHPATVAESALKIGDRWHSGESPVCAAIRAIRDEFPGNPLNPRERYSERGAFEVHPNGDHLHLAGIRTFERGKGHATPLLHAVLRHAKAHGVSVTLDPVPYGPRALPTAKLRAWYSRHGFRTDRSSPGGMKWTPQ